MSDDDLFHLEELLATCIDEGYFNYSMLDKLNHLSQVLSEPSNTSGLYLDDIKELISLVDFGDTVLVNEVTSCIEEMIESISSSMPIGLTFLQPMETSC